MKNNMMTIIKKELVRFFGDKRMAFTTILLPGLMVYVLYSFMGQGLSSQFEADEDYIYQVSVENMPQSVAEAIGQLPMDVTEAEDSGLSSIQEKITDKTTDLLVIFPADFDAKVAEYDSLTAKEAAPLVEIYYNSTSAESQTAYQMVEETLSAYEAMLANKFDVNTGDADYDLASDKDETGQFFSMMLPMLIMVFLFSGCMAIAPEAIAGEKERGTIATLLVTPMKRSQLAFGKIISLGIIGLLSGLSSFIGVMLSLPKLMGQASDSLNASVYSVQDYVWLLLVILCSVLLIVAAMSVISALSKNVKEASTAIMPLMILVMVISVSSMMGSGAPEEWYWYLIPFYNSVQCMNGVFGFTGDALHIILTLASNLVYTCLLATALARIFDSEKIMYS